MTVDSIVNYLMKVECKHCGEQVYPDEDDARDEAEALFEEQDGDVDIDDVRASVRRTCDGCRHFLDKDD